PSLSGPRRSGHRRPPGAAGSGSRTARSARRRGAPIPAKASLSDCPSPDESTRWPVELRHRRPLHSRPRMVPRVIRPLLVAISGLVLAAMVLHVASRLGAFPRGSMLSGASYLPASWWTPLVLPIAAGCWLARCPRLAVALLGAFTPVFALSGDVSLRRRPRLPPDAGRALSVVALNVHYYAEGRANVVHALQGIGADVALLSENVLGPAEFTQMRQELLPADFRMGRSGE